jgi:DNA-binding transcriptional LysR family regulator
MEIWQLRTFKMVAETLNFTRAAERLNLTQSAVSHQIKALEAELGEPLFIRAKRGVKLSQAGKAALDLVQQILNDADALKERISGRENAPTGRVRAAAATQAFVHLFASIFESFMRQFEGVELTFRTTVSTEQTVADILDGTADVGFASIPVYSPSLQVTELFDDELVVVVSSSSPFAKRENIDSSELETQRFILFEPGASIRRATEAFFKRAGISPALALESNDTYFVKWMVQHGMGISLLPSWTIREEVESGTLAGIKIKDHQLRRSVAMVSLSQFQPAATRAFLHYILEHKDQLQNMATP